jgi:riboflavin kinase / FMN adenylyltransferase
VLILDSIDAIPAGLAFWATVGSFDGLHRGHLAVIQATRKAATAAGAACVVITFDPHPSAVLHGEAPPLLVEQREKLARLAAARADVTVVQPFDRAFADQRAEDFVARLRHGRSLRGLVMSPDSALGHDREGTASGLTALARTHGWEVIQVPLITRRGDRVSSGRIRGLVEAGRLGDAADLLGRPYAVIGEVVHGDGRGRELGFPTANLAFDQAVTLPPNGIYAVRVSWGGPDPLHPAQRANGVASLGVRPTFGGGARLLEVFLLDFDGDLYGRRLRVEFVRRQRGERRFSSAESLIEQMGRDAARARELLEQA